MRSKNSLLRLSQLFSTSMRNNIDLLIFPFISFLFKDWLTETKWNAKREIAEPKKKTEFQLLITQFIVYLLVCGM